MADILVVDDDQSIVTAFRRFLSDERHQARFAGDAHDALALVAERRPDLVFMDVRMPGVDGLDALKEMRARHPDLFVVIMTAYGTSQTSIDAIRSGAFEYLAKPLDLDDLRSVISKALAAQQIPGAPQPSAALTGVNLVGQTPAMLQVYRVIGRLATNDVPALLLGERGTGKQLVAETIHDNSTRAQQAFTILDCRSTSDEALAHSLAEWGGTVLLTNIESLSAPNQALVARVLEESQGRRAGVSGRMLPRLLAASEADLQEAVRQGTLHRELYEVFSVITITMPPLRERRDDIPLLIGRMIPRFNAELNRSIKGIDTAVAEAFREHAWPGNVRELESVMKRACILARANIITMDDLGPGLGVQRPAFDAQTDAALRAALVAALHERLDGTGEHAGGAPFHDLLTLVETAIVEEALSITGGNQVKASEILGLNRATLRKKMVQ